MIFSWQIKRSKHSTPATESSKLACGLYFTETIYYTLLYDGTGFFTIYATYIVADHTTTEVTGGGEES